MDLITVEEAFATPAWYEKLERIAPAGMHAFDVRIFRAIPTSPVLKPKLLDFDERLAIMDENGIAMQVLSLTTPGVQILERGEATQFARQTNNFLSGIVARRPKRFAGLATVAPQDPQGAARELERARHELGLKGFLINSHTNDEYLDHPRYAPLLSAAEELAMPLYIHPRAPVSTMAEPFDHYALSGLWGFFVEVSLHVMRMIMGGVFDRHPRLQVVIGHMGEAIPFWLWRVDNKYTQAAAFGIKEKRGFPDLRQLPSQYFQTNITITTSGLEDPGALAFCIEKLGRERILFAIDYPFEDTARAVKFFMQMEMDDQTRELIGSGNSKRVFGLTL